jgi:cytochrome b
MTNNKGTKVWDIAVRIFHWSLVASFTIAYISGEDGEELHVYSGYVVLGLIIFRIIWGFIGSKHARFSDFIYSPVKAIEYLKSIREKKPIHYLGHNPAGGWMIIALMVCILGISWTGLKLYAVDEGKGPLAGTDISLISDANAADEDDDGDKKPFKKNKQEEEFWEEIHETFANIALFLIFLHLVGVFTSSRAHGENLAKAMVTGYKKGSEQ